MLVAARAGKHALLVAPTGAGKTLAGFLPTLVDLIAPSPLSFRGGAGGGGVQPDIASAGSPHPAGRPSFLSGGQDDSPARSSEREGLYTNTLHTLYISPLKALAHDVQRNLLAPIADMGLDIRVETRSGDTPSDRKARQRSRPPQILLTTPESLSLLLSYPDSFTMFASLKTVIIDEVHAFAAGKRGDLLSLSLARLQALSPGMRRVALSATVADADDYRAWLAPFGDIATVELVEGAQGAEPDLSILLPEGRVPWGGHSGHYAMPQIVREIAANRTTLIFCNTRFLAEFVFQKLWELNEDKLPIGIHHGSLSREARRKVENAMADGKLRALVATSSLDLGVDWGDVDCVIQMGAPKGSSRLLQRIGRANHRLDAPSKAILVPGNRFEFLEAQAAFDAVQARARDGDTFRPGGLDVLAQHIMACACAAPFHEDAMLREVQSALPYSGIDKVALGRVLGFVENGGYSLRAYDKFKRLVRERDGAWRLSHHKFAAQHRFNAGIIIDVPMLTVRFRNGRSLGTVEENFAAQFRPGDTFVFAGMGLEVERIKDLDLVVKASKKDAAQIVNYGGARMPLTTHLAARVRGFLTDRAGWARFPDDVREWLEMQDHRSVMPEPDQLLVETFPADKRHYMVCYSFEGWNAHQSLGMLITRRMENAGLQPLGFVANDYALACYSLKPVTDPAPLFSSDILGEELAEWIRSSYLLKRAFREVAVISGLVERQHPGKRKTGRQVTFSTDLIYDVLQKYEPDHVLLEAAWADAREKLTDVGRLADLLDRAEGTMVHVDLDRVSPLAVPLMVIIGRESVPQGAADDALLIEAESYAAAAMRPD